MNIIDDLNDASFELLTQENNMVNFSDDFKGKYVVMGFIYTLPRYLPIGYSKYDQNSERAADADDIQFLGFSFDPNRDTPEVLSNYKDAFKLGSNFDFLTGDSVVVATLMDSLRVRSQVSFNTTTEAGETLYFLNHSDKIMVMDKKSRYNRIWRKPTYGIFLNH